MRKQLNFIKMKKTKNKKNNYFTNVIQITLLIVFSMILVTVITVGNMH